MRKCLGNKIQQKYAPIWKFKYTYREYKHGQEKRKKVEDLRQVESWKYQQIKIKKFSRQRRPPFIR